MNNEAGDDFESNLYHILRTPRRRQTISILYERELPVVPLRSLAREISAREEQVQVSHATGEPYRNVYNSLSQTHLPALQDAGVIIYDPQRQTISPGPNLSVAALLLRIGAVTVAHFEPSTGTDFDDQ
ncbi:DUF7344 domain-containing protein [Halobaculum litoreum]|uniref:DUF7344 domain-containing protein n=1 Tax=Halobaculum litoreum TaxID=3031998 RepID=UPI003D8124CA